MPPILIRLAGTGPAWRLPGPTGPLQIDNLRDLRDDERLLAPCLAALRGVAHVLVPQCGGSPLVPAAAATLPDVEVAVFELDLHDARLLREKLAPLPNVTVRCAADPEPIPAASAVARGAVLLLRTTTDRLLAFDLIERLDRILPPRSPVLVLLPKRRLPDLRRKLDAHLGGLTRRAADRDSAVLAGRTRGDRDAWSERLARFEATTMLDRVQLFSRPGVFCHGRPDAGGLALAEGAVPLAAPGSRVLDLGCGCGIAGLLVAAAMRRLAAGEPVSGEVVLVDSHARAVACAGRGVEANAFPFVRVEHTDQWSGEPGAFDLILGNPPYYAEQRVGAYFAETAARVLRPGGRLLLVSKHGDALSEVVAAHGFAVETTRRRGYDLTLGTRLAAAG